MTTVADSQRTHIAYWITLVLAVAATGILLTALPYAGSGVKWTVHWLPGTGPMAVGLGETGFYATLVTTGACTLALAAARAEMSPATGVLTLLALLGGAVAFLAEHFLARYVALEIVALCVALAPLAEMRRDSDGAAQGRWARLVYLVLRVGDAGLLAGILALWSATGTLEISPALEAGKTLPPATLTWVVGGLLLAVWVKVGGWPLHVWQQAGPELSLFSRSWLYRTLTPNLGLYLLYRITPLLVKTPPLKVGALWVGAFGASWAAALALGTTLGDRDGGRPTRLEAGMTYLGAAQGGLALLLAAGDGKTTVWLAVLVLTPLRLLLSLAGDMAQESPRLRGRRTAAALFGLGALLLVALNALIAWWVRQAGLPLTARLLSQLAVGLIAAWAVVTTAALWRGSPAATEDAPPTVRRWATVSLLAGGTIVGCLLSAPLLNHLAHVAHEGPLALPMPAVVLRALVTGPTGLLAFVLGLSMQRLVKRGALLPGRARIQQGSNPALLLERAIRQSALAVHTVVEAGISQRVLTGLTQGVLGAARLSHRWIEGAFLEGTTRQIAQTTIDSGRMAHRWIEGAFLEGTTRQIAQTTTDSGRMAYQIMEQRGLEGLLRRTVRAVMVGSRWLQRRHTGRLRRNLIWVAASLGLAVLGLILVVW